MGDKNAVEPTTISRDSLFITSRTVLSSEYEIPPIMNTIQRPPVKFFGPVPPRDFSRADDFDQREEAPPVLRALEAAPRALERADKGPPRAPRLPPLPDCSVAISGMGKTLGYSSMFKLLRASSSKIVLIAGT